MILVWVRNIGRDDCVWLKVDFTKKRKFGSFASPLTWGQDSVIISDFMYRVHFVHFMSIEFLVTQGNSISSPLFLSLDEVKIQFSSINFTCLVNPLFILSLSYLRDFLVNKNNNPIDSLVFSLGGVKIWLSSIYFSYPLTHNSFCPLLTSTWLSYDLRKLHFDLVIPRVEGFIQLRL